MTQTNVEIWRHEITSSAGPEDIEGRQIILDRTDPTYQWFLREALNLRRACSEQSLGTIGGSMTVLRCRVANHRQCCYSQVGVKAIEEKREDNEVIRTTRYEVYSVTDEECQALKNEIKQGTVDPNRPDLTLEQLMESGQLPRIESPRLRERIQEEGPEERRTLVVILQMLDIHEVGGNIRRRRGNGDGPKEEEPLLEKMAA